MLYCVGPLNCVVPPTRSTYSLFKFHVRCPLCSGVRVSEGFLHMKFEPPPLRFPTEGRLRGGFDIDSSARLPQHLPVERLVYEHKSTRECRVGVYVCVWSTRVSLRVCRSLATETYENHQSNVAFVCVLCCVPAALGRIAFREIYVQFCSDDSKTCAVFGAPMHPIMLCGRGYLECFAQLFAKFCTILRGGIIHSSRRARASMRQQYKAN